MRWLRARAGFLKINLESTTGSGTFLPFCVERDSTHVHGKKEPDPFDPIPVRVVGQNGARPNCAYRRISLHAGALARVQLTREVIQ